MAAIAHGRELASDDQDFTGDTAWHTVLTAAASNFVAGGKYLLICAVNVIGESAANQTPGCRTCHGTTPTAFAESEMQTEMNATGDGVGREYRFWTVFTQPETAEDIIIQVMTEHSAQTVRTRGGRVIQWLRLDDDLVENTDWFFAEDATTDAMTVGSVETRTTLSVDPPAAGDDWLILGRHRYTHNGAAAGTATIQLVSDPAGTPSVLGGAELFPPNDPTDRMTFVQGYVVENHGDAAVTYGIQDIGGATNTQHTHSAVFALNLDKFAQHVSAYDADTLTAETTYADITPDGWSDPNVGTAGDWFILAFVIYDVSAGSQIDKGRLRIQVDDADEPTGWDVGASQGWTASSAAQVLKGFVPGMPNLTTGVHTVDVDGVASGTFASPEWENRFLVAWSMELAAGASVELPLIASTQVFALSLAGQIQLVLISSTQLFAPTVQGVAATIELPFIGPTAVIFAPQVNSQIQLALITSTQIFSPVTAGQIQLALISSTVVFTPAIGLNTITLDLISSTSVFTPQINGQVTLALIASTAVFAPQLNGQIVLALIASTQVFAPSIPSSILLALISSTQLFALRLVVFDYLLPVAVLSNDGWDTGPTPGGDIDAAIAADDADYITVTV